PIRIDCRCLGELQLVRSRTHRLPEVRVLKDDVHGRHERESHLEGGYVADPDDHYARDDRFFFQAEDGIRDGHVTGVQTCALPIWRRSSMLGTRRVYCSTTAINVPIALAMKR